MSLDCSEFKKWRDKLVKMEREYDAFLKSFLLEMGLRALAKTKKNTPVDTGLLRNSWQLGDSNYTIQTKSNGNGGIDVYTDINNASYSKASVKSVIRKGDLLEITIYNPIEYASFIEYGHRQIVGKYVPILGKKLKQPWVVGKYMATIAIKEIEDQIPTRFEERFKQWIKDLGVE